MAKNELKPTAGEFDISLKPSMNKKEKERSGRQIHGENAEKRMGIQ